MKPDTANCITCEGQGWVPESQDLYSRGWALTEPCPKCNNGEFVEWPMMKEIICEISDG